MILQALTGYYERLAEEGDTNIAPEGFEQKEIPFIIILNRRGEFVGLEDTRTPSGKKLVAREFLVPKERERSGTKAWQAANLLWDHYGYMLAWPKSDSEDHKEMVKKQHGAFVSGVMALFEKYPDDPEIKAVYQFLSKGNFGAAFSDPAWSECKKILGCNLSFRLEGQLRLVCENDNVRAYVASKSSFAPDDEEDGGTEGEVQGICLVTGEYGHIARLHPRTPVQGPERKAKLVSFQKTRDSTLMASSKASMHL